MLKYFFKLHVCCDWGYYDFTLCTVHATFKIGNAQQTTVKTP